MSKNLPCGRIADPIHGYVSFTGMERTILEHRVTQRLRYISQTGLLHLVYPEARTSRFSHSLGAMHLASAFLTSSFRNASPSIKTYLSQALKEAVNSSKSEFEFLDEDEAWKDLQDQPLTAWHHCDREHRVTLMIAEQSLRLAALFHDLGHLPFSHDLETALEEYWRQLSEDRKKNSPLSHLLGNRTSTKIHERIGHDISLPLLRESLHEFPTHSQTIKLVTHIAATLARKILTAKSIPSNDAERAALWLHSLIDGEIDVDRCDYILRDEHNLGFEFAEYDLNRLIDNLTVVQDENTKELILAIQSRGVSAAESFLLARYRSYQYGVRHHKVTQIGAALIHSVANVLSNPPKENETEISQFLQDIGELSNKEGKTPVQETALLKRFALYDDAWMMSILRQQAERMTENGTPDEWLDLVCWRKKGPKSFWKWKGQFPNEAMPLRQWNEAIAQASLSDRTVFAIEWFNAVTRLNQKDVLVIRHTFKPWKPRPHGIGDDSKYKESALCVYQSDGKLEPLSTLSPLVATLQSAWMEDVQVFAFAKSNCTMSAQEVLKELPTSVKQQDVAQQKENEA
jgi:HD superfamily phosphohydrolase